MPLDSLKDEELRNCIWHHLDAIMDIFAAFHNVLQDAEIPPKVQELLAKGLLSEVKDSVEQYWRNLWKQLREERKEGPHIHLAE